MADGGPDGAQEPALPWYVVQTQPGREEDVGAALEQRGFGIYLPLAQIETLKRRVRWGRTYHERRLRTVVAFPTYVFVSFDVGDPAWRGIVRTPGVRRLFSASPERPLRVPPAAMSVLFDSAVDRLIRSDPVPGLIAVGVVVQVAAGPFIGQSAVCEWSAEDRIRLVLQLFGRATRVELRARDVVVLGKPG